MLVHFRQVLLDELLPHVVVVEEEREAVDKEADQPTALHERGKRPKRILFRHVEQEHRGVARHTLCVPELRVVGRVALEETSERLLARLASRAEVDVLRHRPRHILIDLDGVIFCNVGCLCDELMPRGGLPELGRGASCREQLPHEAAHCVRHALADAFAQLVRLATRILLPSLGRRRALLPLLELYVLLAHHVARD